MVWYSQPGIGEWAADSPPVVVGGKVFFVSDRIYCLDENTGNFIWSYKAERAWTDFSPAAAYGKVFVGSDKIYCLDADNGNLIWSYKTGAGVESSPAVAYGRVFAGSDKIYCLDESNGNLIWSFGEDSFWVDTSPAVADGKVFFSSYKTIYCLDADNGNLIWNYETGSGGFSSPAVAEEKVFINSDKVYCLDENSGNLIWSYATKGGINSSPAVADGNVFIGSDKVYCLDANNGNLIWSYATKSDTSPAVAEGKVFFGADKIYCLNADDGKVIWSYETECDVTECDVSSSAAIANGKVFFASSCGGIYCFGFETLVTVIVNKIWSAVESARSIIWSAIVFTGDIGAELLEVAAETMGLTPFGILIIVLLILALILVSMVRSLIQKRNREPIPPEPVREEEGVSGSKPKPIKESLEKRYDILERIGVSASEVHKARKKSDDKIVAIKRPKVEAYRTLSGSVATEFQNEAWIWSKLNHENIVKLYEYGTRPYPWMAMELMSSNLRDKIGKVSLKEALEIAIKLCDALYYIHHRGVAHRDIKPENILFDENGEPKLTDFGIGRLLIEIKGKEGYAGTLNYSAPEQLDQNGEVDTKTDIFQFGILLYEMLTGVHPFGMDAGAAVRKIVGEDPREPSKRNKKIPKELDRIVLKALAKHKQNRYQDISTLREELEQVLGGLK